MSHPLPYAVWFVFLDAERSPHGAHLGGRLFVEGLRESAELSRMRLFVSFDQVADRDLAITRDLLGENNVFEMPQTMGGEDCGRFAKTLGVPGLQYRVGTVPRDRWEASEKPGAEPLPSLHSAKFYPVPEPTVRLSVESMANLALALLQPE